MSDLGESVAFLNGTYEEALQLAHEARDYMAFQERSDRNSLAPESRLAASREAMRITTRIAQVISWLLVQRAVQAGEVTRHEATEEPYRLSGQAVCAEHNKDKTLPPRLTELLERSHRLYERISRLDSMMDGALG